MPAADIVFVGGRVLLDGSGGLVTPGFQDAHAHPLAAGVDLLAATSTTVPPRRKHWARIATYAAAHPDVTWIVGSGWSMGHFAAGTPTMEMLDAVVADRPAILSNSDGHGAWANSLALALAGVDASTPDPPDGRIERDASSAPAGDAARGLGQPGSLPVYLRAHQSGALTARVVAALGWDRPRGGEQVIDLVERRAAAREVGFRATSVKIMQDGVVENFSAGLLESYLDGHGCRPATAG